MYKSQDKLPIVAIVGKPNVGKSSLFNGILRQRKAIVSEESGVTRDINYEVVFHNGIGYRLADSAGYIEKGKDTHEYTQRFNLKLMEEASLIIFVCDVISLELDDFNLAERIRKSGKPAVMVVNKVDNDKLLENYYNFFDLGFPDPIPISVLQGKNIENLKDKITEKIKDLQGGVTRNEQIPDSIMTEKIATIDVAIVGKPNVGKSSLLNLLVGKERALVTPAPGTTRDTVDETVKFEDKIIRFLDTAGLRRKKNIREIIELYSIIRAERAIKDAIVAVLIIDAKDGITTQDKKIASLILKDKKGLIIAANKWDIAMEKNINEGEFVKNVYWSFPHISFADIIPISAKTGYNKLKLLKKILMVYDNYNVRVKTSELNNLMNKLSLHGAYIKYGFQKRTAPPEFEFFISRKAEHKKNFQKFIVNSLRKSFDFRGVPVNVSLRKD